MGLSGQCAASLAEGCLAPKHVPRPLPVTNPCPSHERASAHAGQTGSGKTYTMGSAFTPGGRCEGVIPCAMVDIFARVAETTDAEFVIRVSYVEIFKVKSETHTEPSTTVAESGEQP